MLKKICFVVFCMAFATQQVFAEYSLNVTPEEKAYIAQVVECEAGGEPEDGKRMIAQAIMDYAVDHELTVTEACRALQISTYKRTVTFDSKWAVHEVLDMGKRVTEEHAYWWYAPGKCNGSWHETQHHVITVCCHKFFGPNGNLSGNQTG